MSDPAEHDPPRRVLVIAHAGRDEAREVARAVVTALSSRGLLVRMLTEEADELDLPTSTGVERVPTERAGAEDCELVLVIGGDGTILRAAELVVGTATPLLGVNLGHVGFLAEAESEEVDALIELVVARRWTREDRLVLDVAVYQGKEQITSTWALNEASVEKAARSRMLETVIEVDGRPVSRFGCDGVVCATPTGSTAYNFSAGGPVVWPEVEALLMVPLSAHALFARPMVVAPSSTLAVELLGTTGGQGVLWCDGRRTVDLPPGARVEVRRAAMPLTLARLHAKPFADRLVAKFGLSVEGWRGAAERRRRENGGAVIEEIRITGLGVIEESVLELRPGLSVITGETGAGKTMLITALGLLLGGRADSGAVRTGRRAARVEGIVLSDPDLRELAVEHGADLEDDRVLLARQVSGEGRSRAYLGGVAVPAAVLARAGEALVAVHGQSDQHRLLRPEAQRDALDAFVGAPLPPVLARYRASFESLRSVEEELGEVLGATRERAQEADLLRFGIGEIEELAPAAGEDVALAAEETRLGFADTLRLAAETARVALSADDDASDVLGLLASARQELESVREHDVEAAALADRLAETSYVMADLAADVASYATSVETDPARLAAVSERRARLTALQRKYGDTVEDVLGWAEDAAARLLRLDTSQEHVGALRDRRAALRAELATAALELTRMRTRAAADLADRVTSELASLSMPHARVEVRVGQTEAERGLEVEGRTLAFTTSGTDDVELLLAANSGSDLRPLAKGASGGELSRVMLALEVTLAETRPVPTFVFDEVDAGVGGRAAVEIGRRLAALAAHAQVLVVTHLPQVAAFADQHVVVRKSSDGSVTTSGLEHLDDAGRVQELSRMLAGQESSDTARAHARELLEMARRAR